MKSFVFFVILFNKTLIQLVTPINSAAVQNYCRPFNILILLETAQTVRVFITVYLLKENFVFF